MRYDGPLGEGFNRDPVGERGGINLYGYVYNIPTDCIDPFGESPVAIVAKACKLVSKGYKAYKEGYTFKQAVDAVKAGEDVIAKGRRVAKDIAQAAGDGKNPIHEIDTKTGGRHFHTHDRSGGHVLYSIAGALTVSYYVQGSGALAEGAGAVVDLINPLSIGQDILDIKDVIFNE